MRGRGWSSGLPGNRCVRTHSTNFLCGAGPERRQEGMRDTQTFTLENSSSLLPKSSKHNLLLPTLFLLPSSSSLPPPSPLLILKIHAPAHTCICSSSEIFSCFFFNLHFYLFNYFLLVEGGVVSMYHDEPVRWEGHLGTGSSFSAPGVFGGLDLGHWG